MNTREKQSLDNDRTAKIEEKLWAVFRLNFQLAAREFPDNKIYGTITIEPESARKLIKHFELIVNNNSRAIIQSTFRSISVSGFDTRKKLSKDYYVKIRAIPNDIRLNERESTIHGFSFIKKIFHLNPMVYFEWDDEIKPVLRVEWKHDTDQPIERYILLLDDKEIQYVDQKSFAPKFKFSINDLNRGEKHTIRLMVKMIKKNQQYLSDLITFTVPESTDQTDTVNLTVREEPVPGTLLAIFKMDEETAAASNRFRTNALELLKILEDQIKERNIRSSNN